MNHISSSHTSSSSSSYSDELLRPQDIQIVTYSEEQDRTRNSGQRLVKVSDSERRELNLDGSTINWDPMTPLNTAAGDDQIEMEPPRALPDQQEPQTEAGSDGDGGEDGYRDRMYDLEVLCNLDCGVEGECFMTREDGGIKKRCLCPHGKFGERCSLGRKCLTYQTSAQDQ